MTRVIWAVLGAGIVLLAVALAPVIGFGAVGVAGLLEVVVVVALLAGRREPRAGRREPRAGRREPRAGRREPRAAWWAWLPVPAALLGSIVGVSSAITAFAATAADREYAAAYAARVGFGWLALLCAIVAAVAGMLAIRWPRVAGIVLLLGGLIGGIAINLFYINTWYVGAVLLWWLAALVALVAPHRRVPA